MDEGQEAGRRGRNTTEEKPCPNKDLWRRPVPSSQCRQKLMAATTVQGEVYTKSCR